MSVLCETRNTFLLKQDADNKAKAEVLAAARTGLGKVHWTSGDVHVLEDALPIRELHGGYSGIGPSALLSLHFSMIIINSSLSPSSSPSLPCDHYRGGGRHLS